MLELSTNAAQQAAAANRLRQLLSVNVQPFDLF